MKEKIYQELRNIEKFLEEKGYNVVAIGLYGSQNYNLHDCFSDIDAKAIVMPSIRNLVERKAINKVYAYNDGLVEVKDIISYNNNAYKGNPSFIEPINSKYLIGDPKLIEILQKYNVNPNAVLGMMLGKRRSIENNLPREYKYTEECQYDPKNLHHIYRLQKLANELSVNPKAKPGEFYGEEREFLLNVKRNHVGIKEEVLEVVDKIIEETEMTLERVEYSQANLLDEVVDYIEEQLAKSLLNER